MLIIKINLKGCVRSTQFFYIGIVSAVIDQTDKFMMLLNKNEFTPALNNNNKFNTNNKKE